MAASSGFITRVYGAIQGAPPYIGAQPFSEQVAFSQGQIANFPSTGTEIWPLSQGIQFGNMYCYSIVIVPPSGLQQYGKKYATDQTVATLATLRG